MAYTGIFCTEAEIAIKVGENVDGTGHTEANRNLAAAQAESFINVMCRYNFSDNYAGLNADVKSILSEAAACWIAIDFITYNMEGYTSRAEAESMINVNWAKFWKLMETLRDGKSLTYMQGA